MKQNNGNKRKFQELVVFTLVAISLSGCISKPIEGDPTSISTHIPPTLPTPANLATPQTTMPPSHQISTISDYEFPNSIDPAGQYLFYLHGKIIEDQGIPAISPDYGEYEYEAILEKLSGYDSAVISEQRPKNTDVIAYARKIIKEVNILLDAGVPAKNITIVGASKGAGIAVYVSHLLENSEVNFVIMAICHPDIVETHKKDQIFLTGNVLSIYDRTDKFAGSCQDLFSYSEGKGISRYDEIVLNIGTGHGILYKPLDEWILPTIQWAKSNDK
ncbi:hypothetical protein ACFLXI_04040 [Chloroflexota bacterium]